MVRNAGGLNHFTLVECPNYGLNFTANVLELVMEDTKYALTALEKYLGHP